MQRTLRSSPTNRRFRHLMDQNALTLWGEIISLVAIALFLIAWL
jgi:hypothetical protein